jgi:hypothetical protein
VTSQRSAGHSRARALDSQSAHRLLAALGRRLTEADETRLDLNPDGQPVPPAGIDDLNANIHDA